MAETVLFTTRKEAQDLFPVAVVEEVVMGEALLLETVKMAEKGLLHFEFTFEVVIYDLLHC